jgi:hypothetical protein
MNKRPVFCELCSVFNDAFWVFAARRLSYEARHSEAVQEKGVDVGALFQPLIPGGPDAMSGLPILRVISLQLGNSSSDVRAAVAPCIDYEHQGAGEHQERAVASVFLFLARRSTPAAQVALTHCR